MAITPGDKSTCEWNRLRALGYTGALSDMELAWLQANGATSTNLPDAWMEFLTAAGFLTGSRLDRELAYYQSLAFTVEGDTLIDWRREYWCGAHNPP